MYLIIKKIKVYIKVHFILYRIYMHIKPNLFSIYIKCSFPNLIDVWCIQHIYKRNYCSNLAAKALKKRYCKINWKTLQGHISCLSSLKTNVWNVNRLYIYYRVKKENLSRILTVDTYYLFIIIKHKLTNNMAMKCFVTKYMWKYKTPKTNHVKSECVIC